MKTTAQIKAGLDHPVVDCDGHYLEFTPVVLDYVKDIGGAETMRRFEATPFLDNLNRQSVAGIPLEQRRDSWIEKAHFWIYPQRNTLDRATAHLPGLLSERLEAIGLDHTLLYPTDGNLILAIEDDELRPIACRAFNTYVSELLDGYSRQMTPVALIPMQTPDEALAELDFAIHRLGFKAAVFQQTATRPIAKPAPGGATTRIEYFGIDAEYDYDPVWAACVEHKMAVTFHGVGTGFAPWRNGSYSNHVFNRLGLGGSLFSRSAGALFLGGVTARFPDLRVAFLEGGVAWACALFGQLASLWDKRNADAIQDLDPRHLDRDLMFRLIDEYGDKRTLATIDRIRAAFDRERDLPRPVPIDDFSACGIEVASDIATRFVPNFYFGCEADDPTVVGAFHNDGMPFGARLRPVFGSDIGHFDVSDMEGVLHEAYEPLEHGAITATDFRDFVFANAVRLHGGANPAFFDGTTVEDAAASLLVAEARG